MLLLLLCIVRAFEAWCHVGEVGSFIIPSLSVGENVVPGPRMTEHRAIGYLCMTCSGKHTSISRPPQVRRRASNWAMYDRMVIRCYVCHRQICVV